MLDDVWLMVTPSYHWNGPHVFNVVLHLSLLVLQAEPSKTKTEHTKTSVLGIELKDVDLAQVEF